jgi:hypothetical protein
LRRLINLAIYAMLVVFHEPDGVEGEPSAVFAELISLARQLERERSGSPQEADPSEPRPRFLGPRFAIRANGGEGGIRTLERG